MSGNQAIDCDFVKIVYREAYYYSKPRPISKTPQHLHKTAFYCMFYITDKIAWQTRIWAKCVK